jgi:hypothetical protein
MYKRNAIPVWIGSVVLISVFVMGQDAAAQTDACAGDPCQSIENAVAGTCTSIPGGVCAPDDFTCDCGVGFTWEQATHTCDELPPAKIVFVTDGLYGGGLGGVAGADQICQTEATSAGLPGTYLAWLSETAGITGPINRFTHATIPYRLVNGTEIAQDWTTLTDGSLDSPIAITATGVLVTSDTYVWTNTDPDGVRSSNNENECCKNWTAQSQTGWYGDATKIDAEWTFVWTTECDASYFRLYCFEQ